MALLAALGGTSLAYAPWTQGARVAISKAPGLIRSILPTGDVLSALAGSQFNIVAADVERRIEVLEGSVLFDVMALGPDESFEVSTPESRVSVRGTVFSVERREGRTTVYVHEGLVEVEPLQHEGLPTLYLGAGATWQSGDERVPSLPSGTTRLFDAGFAAAQRRAARVPQARVPQEPVPQEPVPQESELAGAPEATSPPLPARPSTPLSASSIPPAAELRRRQVRRWIQEGRYERARAAAETREWHRLEGDALRALGRFEAAAECYERAQDSGAVYDAAALRFYRLDQAEGALRTLEGVEPGSDVSERALALKVRLLMRLSRAREAAESAEVYRQRYPSGGGVRWLDAEQNEVPEERMQR